MDDQEILNRVIASKHEFGVKCPKYAGAITVEILKLAIQENGFPISERDVFIRGVPVEVDLLMPVPGAILKHKVLYEPSQVRAVFEIKNTGSFGEASVHAIRDNFTKIRQVNENIECLYVTLSERKSYKWAVTTDRLGFESFTLFWHNGSNDYPVFSSSGDWKRLLDKLTSLSEVKGSYPNA